MSDIVERLRDTASCAGCIVDRERASEAADTITRLTAEVERLRSALDEAQQAFALESYNAERLRAALRECEAELNAYYRMEYAGDHPYSQKKLAQAMASNPATVALSGDKQ
jgi:uncharacterized coiled-coil DUF342 family protein